MAVSSAIERINQQAEAHLQADQEKDANSLFFELDKGLRSTNSGERCESIVRFPRLFEKYPFPVIVNSAFLKLADIFLKGTNLMRLCVLQVTEQSEKHLDKIINVSGFLQGIYFVSHSNDPVARALTLRALGSVATIAAKHRNIHHTIISSFESHDSVELKAAVLAADKFCARSKSFTTSVSSKLSEILEALAVPFEMKLRVVPLFRHFYHNDELANQARLLLSKVIECYPMEQCVVKSLYALSRLTLQHLMDTSTQLDLLLLYLQKDCRSVVKHQTLVDLKLFAEKAAHMWSKQQRTQVMEYASSCEDIQVANECLLVLCQLCTSHTSLIHQEQNEALLTLCQSLIYHPEPLLSVPSCQLLTHVALYAKDKQVVQEVCSALETLLLTLVVEPNVTKDLVTICLQCIQYLCQQRRDLTESFARNIVSVLPLTTDGNSVDLLQCLCSLGSHVSLACILSDLEVQLEKLLESSPIKSELILLLVNAIQQSVAGKQIPDTLQQLVLQAAQQCAWLAYRLARQAMRYGQHSLAEKILEHPINQVSSEGNLFWMRGLQLFSEAESVLCQSQSVSDSVHEYLSCLDKAAGVHQRALMQLRAASSPNNPLTFQCTYVQLRIEHLHVLSDLLRACQGFRTSPPPALALAQSASLPFLKYKVISGQLRNCCEDLAALKSSYADLHQSCFDADPVSLLNLKTTGQECHLLNHVVSSFLPQAEQESNRLVSIQEELQKSENVQVELQSVVKAMDLVLCWLEEVQDSGSETPMSREQIECIINSCQLLSAPVPVPRFFFQQLQHTHLKLAVTPSTLHEPYGISYDNDVTIGVEGVCQSSCSKPRPLRKAKLVSVTLKSVFTTKGPATFDVSKSAVGEETTVKRVCALHNDYFKSEFVLSFRTPGLHTVNITTQLVDTDDAEWSTSATATVQVKSTDHDHFHQMQVARQQQRENAIAAASASKNQ